MSDREKLAERLMQRVALAEKDSRFGDAEDMRTAADLLRTPAPVLGEEEIAGVIKDNGYVAPNGHWYLRVAPETIARAILSRLAKAEGNPMSELIQAMSAEELRGIAHKLRTYACAYADAEAAAMAERCLDVASALDASAPLNRAERGQS